MQDCQCPSVLRPLTLCFSQTTSAIMAPELITGAWPVPPSQATSASHGLCSTPTAITCPAQNSQSWEEATPTAGTLGARWKAHGALRRIKTYAWNCVTYPRVVCILSLYFLKMLTVEFACNKSFGYDQGTVGTLVSHLTIIIICFK